MERALGGLHRHTMLASALVDGASVADDFVVLVRLRGEVVAHVARLADVGAVGVAKRAGGLGRGNAVLALAHVGLASHAEHHGAILVLDVLQADVEALVACGARQGACDTASGAHSGGAVAALADVGLAELGRPVQRVARVALLAHVLPGDRALGVPHRDAVVAHATFGDALAVVHEVALVALLASDALMRPACEPGLCRAVLAEALLVPARSVLPKVEHAVAIGADLGAVGVAELPERHLSVVTLTTVAHADATLVDVEARVARLAIDRGMLRAIDAGRCDTLGATASILLASEVGVQVEAGVALAAHHRLVLAARGPHRRGAVHATARVLDAHPLLLLQVLHQAEATETRGAPQGTVLRTSASYSTKAVSAVALVLDAEVAIRQAVPHVASLADLAAEGGAEVALLRDAVAASALVDDLRLHEDALGLHVAGRQVSEARLLSCGLQPSPQKRGLVQHVDGIFGLVGRGHMHDALEDDADRLLVGHRREDAGALPIQQVHALRRDAHADAVNDLLLDGGLEPREDLRGGDQVRVPDVREDEGDGRLVEARATLPEVGAAIDHLRCGPRALPPVVGDARIAVEHALLPHNGRVVSVAQPDAA
mmetsp:Transcript_83717/g.234552  ORF Transcript_83717/g.234552 Transcript_83717/m.234552 type:complete len:602 (+) Transcript_83717:838-2643(+)